MLTRLSGVAAVVLATSALAQSRAQFEVIDFDFAESTPIRDQFASIGVHFSIDGSAEAPIVCVLGAPRTGFESLGFIDGPMPSGTQGLTDPIVGGDTGVGQDIVLDFDTPITALRLYVIDIDGTESVTLRAFDGAAVVDEETFAAGNPLTGDGVSTVFSVEAANITRVVVDVPNRTGVGYAIDQITFTRAGTPTRWACVSQESAPGVGDFDANLKGSLAFFEAGDATLVHVYAYGLIDANAWNGLIFPAAAESTQLALVRTVEGVSLVWVHDRVNNSNGGRGETRVEIVDDPDGAIRVIQDDPVSQEGANAYTGDPGSSVFTSANAWQACCADGVAIGGIAEQATLTLQFTDVDNNAQTPAIQGLQSWRAISADGTSFTLSGQPGRRVRIRLAPCIPDFTNDCRLNVFDFLAFDTAAKNDDPRTDLAPPFGVINLFDYLQFQTYFGNGCD